MRKTIGWTAAALLALLAGACGGSDDGPEATVKAFFEAAQAGDREGFLRHLERKDRELFERLGDGQSGFNATLASGVDFEIERTKVDGDRATVGVAVTRDGRRDSQDLKLVREDGRWVIDLVPDEMTAVIEGFGESMQQVGDDLQQNMASAMEQMAESMARSLRDEAAKPSER